MNIRVCDKCHAGGKLVETDRYLNVKGKSDLRLDLCDDCMKVVKEEYPRVTPEYVQMVYGLKGPRITIETARDILKIK